MRHLIIALTFLSAFSAFGSDYDAHACAAELDGNGYTYSTNVSICETHTQDEIDCAIGLSEENDDNFYSNLSLCEE